MNKLGLVLVAVLAGSIPAFANEGGTLPPANTRPDNIPAVQRGARMFFNYCVGCHSLKYVRYSRIAEDLGLTEEQVMQNLNTTGGKFGEVVISSMPPADAQKWFGKAPPDLSLEARAKGPDWIYNYLKSFYVDPARPLGWNNSVFPNVSMPNVLWELQGTQAAAFEPKPKDAKGVDQACPHGQTEIEGKCLTGFSLVAAGSQSAQQFDETARDITAFLQYVGEPVALKREKLGLWVLAYLGLFTFLAYLLKREYWRDVH